ncbi:MAG: PRC-barrel domain-containing protein [Syntrophaceae bacterium]|nr:PRC-barrel domain-containing protein [Syntrophaceae bacterium]
MFAKKRVSSRLFSMFLIAVIFLLSLSLSSRAAEIKELEEKLPPLVPPPGWYRASRIIDHPVKNDRGEELGEVDDLIIRRNGRVKKVILSVGAFLGIGDRLVAVSFSSLKIDERGNILYRITKEQLEKHPVYTYRKDHPYGLYYSPCPPRGPSYDLYPTGREILSLSHGMDSVFPGPGSNESPLRHDPDWFPRRAHGKSERFYRSS